MSAEISLRSLPYPYRAALAICNDIDEVEGTEEFIEIQRFLNTKKPTRMGEGIGLEIGNSFYFYDRNEQFSFFSRDERARSVILELARAGFVDCLHSYGDAANHRDQVLRALEALDGNDCRLDVWVNHYGARSDLSTKFEYMFGECGGDDPRSDIYHTDLTLDYGIRFVWVGATTRIVGQALRQTSSLPRGVFDRRFPLRSALSVLKEVRKDLLGRLGDERYGMQSRNELMRPLELRDGRRVHEFRRYCNHPSSVGEGATSRGLAYAISERALEQLKARRGFMIVYTHFGKNRDCEGVIAPETRSALRNLEREYRSGEIYVTTTSKLLNYLRIARYLSWSQTTVGGEIRILIERVEDPVSGGFEPLPEQLQGLTFLVPDSGKASVYLGGRPLRDLQRNAADCEGMQSVTVPLRALVYPD